MSDKSFHSDLSAEIDFMDSTEESENEDTECIFCNGKLSQDKRGEIWIKYFSCSLFAHLACTAAKNTDYVCDF